MNLRVHCLTSDALAVTGDGRLAALTAAANLGRPASLIYKVEKVEADESDVSLRTGN